MPSARSGAEGVNHAVSGSGTRWADLKRSEQLDTLRKLQAQGSCRYVSGGQARGSAHDQPEFDKPLTPVRGSVTMNCLER
jgi:hypothetical protein